MAARIWGLRNLGYLGVEFLNDMRRCPCGRLDPRDRAHLTRIARAKPPQFAAARLHQKMQTIAVGELVRLIPWTNFRVIAN